MALGVRRPPIQRQIARQQAARRGRLSIPTVNPNPQPPGTTSSATPGASNADLAAKVATSSVTRMADGQPNTPAQNGVTVSVNPPQTTQDNQPKTPAQNAQPPSQTPQPAATPPAAPTVTPTQPAASSTLQNTIASPNNLNPGDLFQFSSYQPGAGQPDPRDATYWSNLSKLMFNAQQNYAQNLQTQNTADLTFQTNQTQENLTRQQQQRTLAENAMRANLSASGWLDRNDSEQTQAFLTQVSSEIAGKSADDAARTAARSAIVQGFSIDEAGLLAQAAANYAQNQLQLGQTGTPDYTNTPTSSATSGGGGGGRGGRGGGRSGGGGFINPPGPRGGPGQNVPGKPKPKGKR